jgi:hypothetical protein
MIEYRNPVVRVRFGRHAGIIDRAAGVHQIEMSPFLPFRNVTNGWAGWRAGAEPWRSAAPDRRPRHERLKPHRLFYRAGVQRARLVEELGGDKLSLHQSRPKPRGGSTLSI